jgi:hypothetical protein
VRRLPAGDETIEVWSALDALVLKATAIVLAGHWLPDLSSHCWDRSQNRQHSRSHERQRPVVWFEAHI